MATEGDIANHDDPFDLARFEQAQENVYATALAELQNGDKRSHWMWFIFPQIDGLGYSRTTRRYAIKSKEEARQYLHRPVLGKRLIECGQAVLDVTGRTAHQIFGFPDDAKLSSSMTLFAEVASTPSVFEQVLDKYFDGVRDARTLAILARLDHDQA